VSCVDSKVRYHYFRPPEEYYCSSSVFVPRIHKLTRNTKFLMACNLAELKINLEFWRWNLMLGRLERRKHVQSMWY